MAHKIEEIVTNAVLPIAEKLQYELVDVEYRKRDKEPYITVYIYKEGGITLGDCEKMHLAIDDEIDRVDPTGGQSYTLNVSSPGLDRAFKNERDYTRNIGEDVEIKFYKPFLEKKKIEAKLVEYNDSNIKVVYEGKEILIRLDKIAKINLAVKF